MDKIIRTYVDDFQMVNIDHEVVFRASTLVHHELQPHDICFKFTVKPVKKCDKFTVSSSIYVPSAHSRISAEERDVKWAMIESIGA
jgi:hypothetical protein